uniref:CUB_2 domain-containing protein n=1 Tax=Steinernema glaseri TaxID=37863 RepID=A0A1I7YBN8_9BILA
MASFSFTLRGDHKFPMTFFNKSLSVKFRSSADPEYQNENGFYSVRLSYVNMSNVMDKNTVIPVTSSRIYYLGYDFHEKFSSVTYTLGEELRGKKLQLYPLTLSWSTRDVAILDGNLLSPVTTTSVGALLSSASSSAYRPAFTSTTGNITLLWLHSGLYDAFNFFIKVHDDSRDCDGQESVYYVDDNLAYHHHALFTASSTRLQFCPLIVTIQRASLDDGLALRINSLEGTDKNVSVLPGSDFSVTPFFEFNQQNQDKWSYTRLSGDVFSLLVPVGGTLNFTAKLGDLYANTICGDKYVDNPQNGIFMSRVYRYNNSSLHKGYEYPELDIQSCTRAGHSFKKFKVDFDVFVEELAPSSSLRVFANSNSILNLSAVQNFTKSYSTGYTTSVTFTYDGSKGEKGFFIRYRMTPDNDTTPGGAGHLARLSGATALFVVFYSLMNA